MRISEVAKRVGIRSSAIRYYEKIGLLPQAPRQGGARVYQRDVLDYLTVIQFGIRTGFKLKELRLLFDSGSTRAARRDLAQGRLHQLRLQQERLKAQEKLLANVRLCRCG